jgi:NAD(P)-dependent dehydrogenase (short-subunit alcohol dehydrogenase family)
VKKQTKNLRAKDPGDPKQRAQSNMKDQPVTVRKDYKPSDKLFGKVALITGGDSGIGRSVAVYFAKEGADIAIVYNDPIEDRDAQATRELVEAEDRRCEIIRGDIGRPAFCESVIKRVVKKFGRLDILVNNAAEQHPREDLKDISVEQVKRTFDSKFFGAFYLSNAALPHLKKRKGTIINTVSVVAYRGSPTLLDYSSTKGALLAFTRTLAIQQAENGVRVNAVAPGPIWTPLIPSTFPKDKAAKFGKDTPMGRPGQPFEVAGAYVFLASDDATYISGQVIHVNGGEIVNA